MDTNELGFLIAISTLVASFLAFELYLQGRKRIWRKDAQAQRRVNYILSE